MSTRFLRSAKAVLALFTLWAYGLIGEGQQNNNFPSFTHYETMINKSMDGWFAQGPYPRNGPLRRGTQNSPGLLFVGDLMGDAWCGDSKFTRNMARLQVPCLRKRWLINIMDRRR